MGFWPKPDSTWNILWPKIVEVRPRALQMLTPALTHAHTSVPCPVSPSSSDKLGPAWFVHEMHGLLCHLLFKYNTLYFKEGRRSNETARNSARHLGWNYQITMPAFSRLKYHSIIMSAGHERKSLVLVYWVLPQVVFQLSPAYWIKTTSAV